MDYAILKSLGWSPKNILDIGAYKGHWTHETRRWFPNATYTLIEANDNPSLRNLPYRIISSVLSSKIQDVEWFSNGSTGDSIFRERTRHYDTIAPITRKTTTLDTLFPNETFEFIKIDCQGAELEILAGGTEVVSRTEVLLLECPFAGQYNQGAPTFADYIGTLDSLGFAPLEIPELHRANDVLCQIDILFLRKTSPFWNMIQGRLTR